MLHVRLWRQRVLPLSSCAMVVVSIRKAMGIATIVCLLGMAASVATILTMISPPTSLVALIEPTTTAFAAITSTAVTSSTIASPSASIKPASSPTTTIEVTLRWPWRWHAACHQLAQIVRPLERAVKLFLHIPIIVAQPTSVLLLRCIAAVDERLSAVMTRCTEASGSPLFVESTPTQSASATALRRLLLSLVFCLFLIIGEL